MKISVITISYNSSTTIKQTLKSVQKQSHPHIEHIIVDGGSKDQTVPLLKKYSKKNRKYYIKKNFGIYKSINYGISKAKGDYICILHSDDIFQSNDTIKELSHIVSKNKSYVLYIELAIFTLVKFKNLS